MKVMRIFLVGSVIFGAIHAHAQQGVRDIERLIANPVITANKQVKEYSGAQPAISPDGSVLAYIARLSLSGEKNPSVLPDYHLYIHHRTMGKIDSLELPELPNSDQISRSLFIGEINLERSEMIGKVSREDAEALFPNERISDVNSRFEDLQVSYRFDTKTFSLLRLFRSAASDVYAKPEALSRNGRFMGASGYDIHYLENDVLFQFEIADRDTGVVRTFSVQDTPNIGRLAGVDVKAISDDGTKALILIHLIGDDGLVPQYRPDYGLYLFDLATATFQRVDQPAVTDCTIPGIDAVLTDRTLSTLAYTLSCEITVLRNIPDGPARIAFNRLDDASVEPVSMSSNGRFLAATVKSKASGGNFIEEGNRINQKYGLIRLFDSQTGNTEIVTKNRHGVIENKIFSTVKGAHSLSDDGILAFTHDDSDIDRLLAGGLNSPQNVLRSTGPALSGVDLCPADDNKIAAGRCGCGVSEVDNNFDGVLDCGTPPEQPRLSIKISRGMVICTVDPGQGITAKEIRATTVKAKSKKKRTLPRIDVATKPGEALFSALRLTKKATVTCHYKNLKASMIR